MQPLFSVCPRMAIHGHSFRVKRLTGLVALSLLVPLIFLGSTACAESNKTAEENASTIVKMTNAKTFQPQEVTVHAGGTVRWENVSYLVHTVTADPTRADDRDNVQLPGGAQAFHSGDIAPQESFSRTFTVPGRYKYFCEPHEAADMVGIVVVKER